MMRTQWWNETKSLNEDDILQLLEPGLYLDGRLSDLQSRSGDGQLFLKVNPAGERKWVLHWKKGTVRRELSLGHLEKVELAQARASAVRLQDEIKAGKDPFVERRRTVKRLTSKEVEHLREPGLHADGEGLYLKISQTGAKRWVFLWRKASARHELTIGRVETIKLAEAREEAARLRRDLREGRDPLAARRFLQAARVVEETSPSAPFGLGSTFGDVAEQVIAKKTEESKNLKHKAQWKSTLRQYCTSIWNKSVAEISTSDVQSVLMQPVKTKGQPGATPLWQAVPETANRLRGRIEAVLSAATAGGIRQGPNAAAWRGHLQFLLPKLRRLTRGHHPALPYSEMADFWKALGVCEGVSALALQFTILTVVRTSEALNASWSEIDFERNVWTIPDQRMKAGVEHDVPLTPAAMAILESVRPFGRDDGFVFPGRKASRPLSNMAMLLVLRRMNRGELSVHGFRSTYRQWAGDLTQFPRNIVEEVLAHAVGNKVERSYRRRPGIEKRREVLEAWSRYVAGQGDAAQN